MHTKTTMATLPSRVCLLWLVVYLTVASAECCQRQDIARGLDSMKDLIAAERFTNSLSGMRPAQLTQIVNSIALLFGILGSTSNSLSGIGSLKAELADINHKLDMLRHDTRHVDGMIEWNKVTLEVSFSSIESTIHNLSGMLNDILRDTNHTKAILHFNTAYENDMGMAGSNLFEMMTRNTSSISGNIIHAALNFSRNHRSLMHKYMRGLSSMIMQGMMIDLAYHALQNDSILEHSKDIWKTRIAHVWTKRGAVDAAMRSNWWTDGANDLDRLARVAEDSSNADFCDVLYDMLVNKYYWRMWAVAVYDDVYGWDHHCIGGSGGITRLRFHGRNIVVSSTDRSRYAIASIPTSLPGNFNDARDVYGSLPGANAWFRIAVMADSGLHVRGPTNRIYHGTAGSSGWYHYRYDYYIAKY